MVIETYVARRHDEAPQICCSECVYLYAVAKANGRTHAPREETIAAARLLKLFRALNAEQQDQMQRLLVLLRNQSPRANRLLQMAVDGQLQLEDLLALV